MELEEAAERAPLAARQRKAELQNQLETRWATVGHDGPRWATMGHGHGVVMKHVTSLVVSVGIEWYSLDVHFEENIF